MLPRIQLRHLTHFIQVAREGTVRKAAATLNISQPAVTRSVKELEQLLGVALFERSRSGVILNAYGQCLLRHSDQAMAALNAAVLELNSLKQDAQGRVVLCGPTVSMSRLVPRAVARLKRRLPLVDVSIVPGTLTQMLPRLRLGEIDLFFGRCGTPEQMVGLVFKRLFQDRLVIVSRPSHTLAERRDPTLEELAGFPWIVPHTDDSFRDFLADIFGRSDVRFPKNCIEMGFGPSLWTYMDEAGALAAMPSNLVSDDIRTGRLEIVRSDKSWALPPFGVCFFSERSLSPPARLLVEELIRVSIQRRHEMKDMLAALNLTLDEKAS